MSSVSSGIDEPLEVEPHRDPLDPCEAIEQGRRHSIDADLVFLDLLVRPGHGLRELRLGLTHKTAPGADRLLDVNVYRALKGAGVNYPHGAIIATVRGMDQSKVESFGFSRVPAPQECCGADAECAAGEPKRVAESPERLTIQRPASRPAAPSAATKGLQMTQPNDTLLTAIACEFAMAIEDIELWDDDWIYPDDFEEAIAEMGMQRAQRVMAMIEGRPMPPASYLPPAD